MYRLRISELLSSVVLYIRPRPSFGLKFWLDWPISKPLSWSGCRSTWHRLKTTQRAINSGLNANAKYPTTLLSFYALLRTISAAAPDKDGKQKEEVDIDTLIFEADDLFNQNKYSEIVELLQNFKESDNVEILWRLSRALYNMSKADKSSKASELINQSYFIVKRALDLDDNNFAVHKWYSVLLDAHAGTQGVKARLTNIETVKEHMMKATAMNPKDATTLYMLGAWCFGVAELSWYKRQIVSALIATPPTSSFEEALSYFIKAEETSPQFYSVNLLMLGKTYLRLSNVDKARHYLTLASKYSARTDEDQQAIKEAADLLKKIS